MGRAELAADAEAGERDVSTDLPAGLYAVVHDRYGICAGLIVADGRVLEAAPILRKRLGWWLTSGHLRRVGP